MEAKKKKAMISQLMNGLSDEKIEKTKLKATKELSALGYEVVDSFFNGGEECEWADNQKKCSRCIPSFKPCKDGRSRCGVFL